ncbi:MAG: glycosyltransferase family 2 protein [Blastocatellia bacterium]
MKDDERQTPLITIIIPALNEEKSIGHVLRDIPWDNVHEVIVVDNGSDDATAQVARTHGARVIVEPERGYGAACLAGMAALDARARIVVFLDADYSDFPEQLPALLAPILNGQADFVIGTRMRDAETRRAMTPPQRWGNRLAVTLIRWRFGFRYTDLGPFRAIRREALDALGMVDRNYGWTVEMQIRAVRRRLRIVEIPVAYRIRIGRSKISGTVRGVILAGAKILWTIFRYAIR